MLLFLTAVVGGVGSFGAQDPPPSPNVALPEDPAQVLPIPDEIPDELRSVIEELADEGVTVDFERRRVEVRGVILLDVMNAGYPIEYLIVTHGGATHESLGLVRCTPSKLNAAFLALRLEPGRTVEFVRKDPAPPLEQLQSGEETEFDVTPPHGTVVDVLVRWSEDGREVIHPIEDLLAYTTNGRTLPRRGFVYIGSTFKRVVIGTERVERYMADLEGNVVALFLKGFGHCLFDMNSVEGAEAYLYDVNRELCPVRGTKVSFVFQLRS